MASGMGSEADTIPSSLFWFSKQAQACQGEGGGAPAPHTSRGLHAGAHPPADVREANVDRKGRVT